MVGKTLGHYEILEPLGTGGMGEVYRARDTKLDRDVAIKVLPEDFATDAERLARFEREAKLLASINHANIAAIYGLEDQGDQRFIVMEVVEGATLGDRIRRSGRIDVEEALAIARQVAEALEAAHAGGVIHRDLKPANVMVTAAGKVKVLDFGLAKAYETGGATGTGSLNLSQSPTMMEATRAGMIMGTAAYMSPEQAKGKSVDKRSDIWSFGALLYEMLTGTNAFAGEDVSETLAAILKDQPDWSELPNDTPRTTAALLRRCLAKDPNSRLHDIADARIEIAEAIALPETTGDHAPASSPRPGWRFALPWAVAAVAVVVALASGLGPTAPTIETAGQVKFTISLPDGLRLFDHKVGISDDGTLIAMMLENSNGEVGIWLRYIDDTKLRPLDEAQNLGVVAANVSAPSFSPGGDWIIYSDAEQFYRVSIDGGAPQPIGEGYPRGAAWLDDDRAIFGRIREGLFSFPLSGASEPQRFANIRGERIIQRFPQALSDGRVLFTEGEMATFPNDWTIAVVPAGGGDPETVFVGGTFGRYLPTGHVVFGRRNALYAVDVDPLTLESIGGVEFLVLADVWMDNDGETRGWAGFDVSSNGTIVYAPYQAPPPMLPVIVDENGTPTPLGLDAGFYDRPRIAPRTEGRGLTIAIPERDEQYSWKVVIYAEGEAIRSLEDVDARSLAWSQDGESLAVIRAVGTGSSELAVVDAQGEEPDLPIRETGGAGSYHVIGFADDDRKLLYESWVEHPDGDRNSAMEYDFDLGEPRELVEDALFTVLSPRETQLAYMYADEVWVRDYVPGQQPGAARAVSTAGGSFPAWSPEGDKLFYFDPDDNAMVVDMDANPGTDAAQPTMKFSTATIEAMDWWIGFGFVDVLPNDAGFVGFQRVGPRLPPIEPVVITNWFEKVKELAPTGGSR